MMLIICSRGLAQAFRSTAALSTSSAYTCLCHKHHMTAHRHMSNSTTASPQKSSDVTIQGLTYPTDSYTNVTPRIISKVGCNLHNQKYHPLNLIRHRIQNYFDTYFTTHIGSPVFSVFDNISPVVSVYQNFDSLLFPPDHPGRTVSDTYYVNSQQLLRAHTTAHQEDLIKMGLDAFLVAGDVYRRDEIDASHYPVFHQMDAVRLFQEKELFARVNDPTNLSIFEDGKRTADKQEFHSLEAAKLLEYDLKKTLSGLADCLFGKEVEMRWVDDVYFPFTHPSWELEIMFEGEWLEVLGCGITEQKILHNAGASHKVGWAFGLGLERLAMKLYNIPDIRLFWSNDPGFLKQFRVDDPNTPITYKPISSYPPCINDMSFWIPNEEFRSNDFYDLVRSVAGDIVERVELVDEFTQVAKQRTSHCYRITYRHMDKTFTQAEVNDLHTKVGRAATDLLGVTLR
ncbi:hypothetical protein NP493_37g08018 [Ridgeia piscesae]|uniref:Phenylalanine--tRNA ligase, mitochondrial n=1 Tax=Ridgeia piscesae TaxID=27915 RepID=A0AAD9UK37_RIDPI|nr:hypothetical protein NP493_37g08018 [Ridgeia piscesae]